MVAFPNTKVMGGSLAGALTIILNTVATQVFSVTLTPEQAGAIAVVVSFLAAWVLPASVSSSIPSPAAATMQ